MILFSLSACFKAARSGLTAMSIALVAFAASIVGAQTVTGTWAPTSASPSQAATLTLAYTGFTTQNLGYRFRVYFNSAQLTFVSAANSAAPTGAYQGDSGALADGANGDADGTTNSYVELVWVDLGNSWPTSAAGTLGTVSFTTTAAFAGTTANLRESATGGQIRNVPGSAAALALVVAPVPTAPTVSALAGTTLVGGTGTVPVNVATAGVATGSLGLACTIPAGTAAFAVTAGGTRTITAPAVVGANAPAIGLSCTPQATAQNATLTCAQTATPAPNPPSLTATITCPAIVVVTPAVLPVTAPGAVTLPAYAAGSASSTSTPLTFNATGGAASLSCVAAGAGYTAAPNPLSLTVGTPGTVTVTYTGTTIGTFTGTLTCTSAAPATGGPFVYNLSTTVAAAPVATPAVSVPTMGAFGLGLLSLLVAGFAGFVQRRRG